MNAIDVLVLLVVVAMPVLLGAGAAMMHRPWWWAAVAAVVLVLVALVAPEPEPGEPRLAAGDVPFVLVVSAVVVALVWLGSRIGRRLSRSRAAN